jgi:DNA-binding response OmpR family regulator
MGANILLVEDEEKLARFIELELCYEGYTVTKAYTADPASSLPCRRILILYCLILCFRN